jgi:hypothetical protein
MPSARVIYNLVGCSSLEGIVLPLSVKIRAISRIIVHLRHGVGLLSVGLVVVKTTSGERIF